MPECCRAVMPTGASERFLRASNHVAGQAGAAPWRAVNLCGIPTSGPRKSNRVHLVRCLSEGDNSRRF